MLALDSTIGCIEASESEVVDLYRAAAITRSSSPNSRPETMEAYLCAIRKKAQQVKVYLAFVVNDHKIYVYTTPGKGKSEEEYPDEVEEALGCARAMGFSPERVDLSYSPAMREVVVRNTKILRLPGSKGGGALKHGLTGAPVLPLPPSTPAPVPASAVMPATAPAAGKEGGNGAPEPRKALADLKKEQQALLAERDLLASQLGQISAQHHELAGVLAGVKESHAKLAAERDALLPLRKQVDELLPAKDLQLAQLQERVDELGRQLEGATGRQAEMERQHGAMVENLAQARQDIAKLSAERDSALQGSALATEQHREAAAQLDELRQQLVRIKGESEGALQRAGALEEQKGKLEGELAELRQELTRVGSEKDAALGRVAALEGQKEAAESELAALHQELAGMGAEKDAAVQRLALLEGQKGPGETELTDLQQEVARIGTERDAALERVAVLEGQKGPAEAELAELRHELARAGAEKDAALERVAALEERQAQQGIAGEVAALRQELAELRAEKRRLTEEKEAALAPAAAGPAPSAVPPQQESDDQFPPRILQGLQDSAFEARPAFAESTLPAFEATQQQEQAWGVPEPAEVTTPAGTGVEFPSMEEPASFVPLGELQGGFFSAADDGAPVRFLLESGLTAIEYPTYDDVLELHHSINNAYLSPEGTGGQESCQGYICCLRKEGSRQVFAAIYGTKSRRTRVYLPELQPQDDDSYARTVRGAISFAEEVGLMMEPVPLEGSAEKREERIKRCPALRRAEQK